MYANHIFYHCIPFEEQGTVMAKKLASTQIRDSLVNGPGVHNCEYICDSVSHNQYLNKYLS